MKTIKSIYLIVFLLVTGAVFAENKKPGALVRSTLKGLEYRIKAGVNIGGTSPLPLPAEIREINSYRPGAQLAIEGNIIKWFDRAVSDETFDLAKLAEHMSKHNSPYSSGVIKGVLTDMVDCIKELLLDGKSVKIDDLAIFGVGIRSKAAETLEEFSLEKNITGMRLKARATGNLSTTNLKLDSQLKQQAEYQKPTTPGGGSGSSNTPDPKPNPDEGDEEAPDPTV